MKVGDPFFFIYDKKNYSIFDIGKVHAIDNGRLVITLAEGEIREMLTSNSYVNKHLTLISGKSPKIVGARHVAFRLLFHQR